VSHSITFVDFEWRDARGPIFTADLSIYARTVWPTAIKISILH